MLAGGAEDLYETALVNSRLVDGTIGDAKDMPPQRDGKKKKENNEVDDAEGGSRMRKPAAAKGAGMRKPAAAFPALTDGVNNLQLQVVAGHKGAQTVVLRTLASDKKQILNISAKEADDPTLIAKHVIKDIKPSIVNRDVPAPGTVASLSAELVEEFREIARDAKRARLAE